MVKARFTEYQQPVSVVRDDESVYIFICLNGADKSELLENEEITYWECDYNEIHVPNNVLDIDDVVSNPDKYLDYTYDSKSSDNDKIEQLRADIDFIAMMSGVEI